MSFAAPCWQISTAINTLAQPTLCWAPDESTTSNLTTNPAPLAKENRSQASNNCIVNHSEEIPFSSGFQWGLLYPWNRGLSRIWFWLLLGLKMKYEQDHKKRIRTTEKRGKLISWDTASWSSWKNKIIHKLSLVLKELMPLVSINACEDYPWKYPLHRWESKLCSSPVK